MATITETPARELSGNDIGFLVRARLDENTEARGILTAVHHDIDTLLYDWSGAAARTALRVTLTIDKVGAVTVNHGTLIEVEHD